MQPGRHRIWERRYPLVVRPQREEGRAAVEVADDGTGGRDRPARISRVSLAWTADSDARRSAGPAGEKRRRGSDDGDDEETAHGGHEEQNTASPGRGALPAQRAMGDAGCAGWSVARRARAFAELRLLFGAADW